jgi:hypothetical protein
VPLAFLLLAASVGIIPVPEVVKRFPDPSYYPGVGVQREAHMLESSSGRWRRSCSPVVRGRASCWRAFWQTSWTETSG